MHGWCKGRYDTISTVIIGQAGTKGGMVQFLRLLYAGLEQYKRRYGTILTVTIGRAGTRGGTVPIIKLIISDLCKWADAQVWVKMKRIAVLQPDITGYSTNSCIGGEILFLTIYEYLEKGTDSRHFTQIFSSLNLSINIF